MILLNNRSYQFFRLCNNLCSFHVDSHLFPRAITIDVPVAGLPEYLAKRGLA